MSFPLSSWAACLLVGGALPALAPAGSGPADPLVAVPPQTHESALQRYRPLSAAEPAKPADWRSANRRVQQAGHGHSHAPEAAEAAASAASTHKH
jgi:hypothetical protein